MIAIDRGGKTEVDVDLVEFDDEFVEIYVRMNPFKGIWVLLIIIIFNYNKK